MKPPNESQNKPDDGRRTILQGYVRAESLVQIALALPLSVVIGWGIGDFLDHKLHQSWIAIVGLFVGIAAGFVQVIRLATRANRDVGD
jgi:ATP synthase protein I